MAEIHDLDRSEVKDAYHKLLSITEARLEFAGTIEAIRLRNSPHGSQNFAQRKQDTEVAEQAFDEVEVRRTLLLRDDGSVWKKYVTTKKAYTGYIKRSAPQDSAQQGRVSIDALLESGEDHPKTDDDPETRDLYSTINNAYSKLIDTMQKRLQK